MAARIPAVDRLDPPALEELVIGFCRTIALHGL